jgi:DNA-directed RNA polymerase subunit beta'
MTQRGEAVGVIAAQSIGEHINITHVLSTLEVAGGISEESSIITKSRVNLKLKI